MSKFATAFARSLLQIGGAAIGIPAVAAGGSVTSPETLAALVAMGIGATWSQYRADKTNKLAKYVDAVTPSSVSYKDVEAGTIKPSGVG